MRACVLLLALLLAGCGWFFPRQVVVEPGVPLGGPAEVDRSLEVMNFAVSYCGFQPNQTDVEAMLEANPARTSESTAAAICGAMAPRLAIRRGWILPQVDGVPVRGRWMR